MDWTGLATLVAASAAAVLSAVSLLLSGRREDKRWKREVLEETMVSLFDSSFNSPLTAAIAAREAGQDTEWHKARALDAHAVQMQALTRLRFLAKPEVVDYAFQLHDVEDQLYEAAFRERGRFSAAQLQNLKDRRWSLRTELFNASRRNLGLRRSLPVRSSLHSGPTTEEIVNHEMKRQQPGTLSRADLRQRHQRDSTRRCPGAKSCRSDQQSRSALLTPRRNDDYAVAAIAPGSRVESIDRCAPPPPPDPMPPLPPLPALAVPVSVPSPPSP